MTNQPPTANPIAGDGIDRRELLARGAVGAAVVGLGTGTAAAQAIGGAGEAGRSQNAGTRRVARSLHNKAGEVVSLKDFGAFGDGLNDDTPAFRAFTTAYNGEDAMLYMPPGDYRLSYDFHSFSPFQSLNSIVVLGYGSTMKHTNDNNFQVGGKGGNAEVNNGFAPDPSYILTAARGDTTLTLVNSGEASFFSANQWILIGALDLQGYGGPPNLWDFEFNQISSVVGSTINLVFPLKHTYRSTYPTYPNGRLAGPASIYAFNSTWVPGVIEFRGVHFTNSGTISCQSRRVKFVDCKFECNPLIELTQQYVMEGCTHLNDKDVEVDKVAESVIIRNSTLNGITFQSASIDHVLIENCEIGTYAERGHGMWGTPRNLIIRNSHLIGLDLGPRQYGVTESIVLENCQIDRLNNTSQFNRKSMALFTVSNGTLVVSNTDNVNVLPVPWAVPGGKAFFVSDRVFPNPVVCTNVRQDATNTYIDTATLGTSMPAFSGVDVPGYFQTVSAPRITARGCTGDPQLLDLSNATADAPAYTYARRAFTSAPTSGFATYGYLVKVRFNVIRAYTGVQGTLNMSCETYVINSSFVSSLWKWVINLKTAGERVLLPGSVNGLQTGDSIPTLATGTWFGLGPGMNRIAGPISYSANISGEARNLWPLVEVEVLTDQGVVGMDLISGVVNSGV